MMMSGAISVAIGMLPEMNTIDPYSPTAPTHIQRSFEEGRQMLESRVEAMLEDVVTSPLVPRVAKLIEKRLGRKLR